MISILVVVPTLDSYQLLSRLVKSITDQTFTGWRVLFIDGESSQVHKRWLQSLCSQDSRFNWEEENNRGKGIYTAMNQGFQHATEEDWVLFWGSDDIAADKDVFKRVEQRLLSMMTMPDLYICRARYYSMERLFDGSYRMKMQRYSTFIPRRTFKKSLFWGSTPPHQGTFFGPGARRVLGSYDESYKLTGDLDYFLRLSQFSELRVFVDHLLLVFMGDSGISAKENKRRIIEVMKSYKITFRHLWLLPFLMRYFYRLKSLMVQI
jgi:glycosyltransferase involved in cell wall biosynthesis